MRYIALLILTLLPAISFSQANLTYIKSFDSTFTILDKSITPDTLIKITKQGDIVKYESDVPVDTVMNKSDTARVAAFALNAGSASDSILISFSDTLTIRGDTLDGSDLNLITNTIKTNSVQNRDVDLTIQSSENVNIIGDSIDLFTNRVTLGNTVIDSTSITLGQFTPGQESFTSHIYFKSDSVQDRIDASLYSSSGVTDVTFTPTSGERYKKTNATDDKFIERVSNATSTNSTYGLEASSETGSEVFFNLASGTVDRASIQIRPYNNQAERDAFYVENDSMSFLIDLVKVLKIEEDSLIAPDLIATFEGISVGGGDVLTSTDTITLKEAFESESFDEGTIDTLTTSTIVSKDTLLLFKGFDGDTAMAILNDTALIPGVLGFWSPELDIYGDISEGGDGALEIRGIESIDLNAPYYKFNTFSENIGDIISIGLNGQAIPVTPQTAAPSQEATNPGPEVMIAGEENTGGVNLVLANDFTDPSFQWSFTYTNLQNQASTIILRLYSRLPPATDSTELGAPIIENAGKNETKTIFGNLTIPTTLAEGTILTYTAESSTNATMEDIFIYIADGTAGITSEFNDSQFRIISNANGNKAAFDASLLTTDRTFTFPDTSGIVAVDSMTNNFTFGGNVLIKDALTTDDEIKLRFNENQYTTMTSENTGTSGILYSINPIPGAGDQNAFIRLFRETNTTGDAQINVHLGDGTSTVNHKISANDDSFLHSQTGKLTIGSTSQVTDAILNVSSTTGAFMPPRMTGTQRDNLSASDGMQLYNTSSDKMNFYENGSWNELALAVKGTDTLIVEDFANDSMAIRGELFVENGVGTNAIELSKTSQDYKENVLYHDITTHDLRFYNDIPNHSRRISTNQYDRYYNSMVDTIKKGTIVRSDGMWINGEIVFEATLAGNSRMDSLLGIAMAAHDCPPSQFCDVLVTGKLEFMNTSAFTDNSPYYIGKAGGITAISPSAPDLDKIGGYIGYADADSGTLYFSTWPQIKYSPTPKLSAQYYDSTITITNPGQNSPAQITNTVNGLYTQITNNGFTFSGDTIRPLVAGGYTITTSQSFYGEDASDVNWKLAVYKNGVLYSVQERGTTTSTLAGNVTVISDIEMVVGDYLTIEVINSSNGTDDAIFVSGAFVIKLDNN